MMDLYFNDCLPSNFGNKMISVLDGLHKMKSLLTNQGVPTTNGIVLSDSADKVFINGISLADYIRNLPKEEKTYFAACFYMKQPIGELINDYPSEDSIKFLYDCRFNGRKANNLAAAGIMGYLALSLPVEKELISDTLSIDVINPDTKSEEEPVKIVNFHGGNLSTILNLLIPQGTSLLEVLKRDFEVTGKNCYLTSEFENIWKGINTDFQRGIISRFKDARNANLVFPPKEDNNIVKGDKAGTTVFELREKAHSLRVYFKSGTKSIVIGWYGTKTEFYGADQSSDFRHANKIIDEYIARHNVIL